MRPLLSAIFAPLMFSASLSVSAQASDATAPIPDTPESYELNHLKHFTSYAEKIALADHATLYRLSGTMEQPLDKDGPPPPGVFAIKREKSTIRATQSIDADATKPLVAALRAFLVAPPKEGANCFEPAWGIDLYTKDGSLIFHGMFCFWCSNDRFQIGDTIDGSEMPGDPDKRTLYTLLDKLFPAPAAAPPPPPLQQPALPPLPQPPPAAK